MLIIGSFMKPIKKDKPDTKTNFQEFLNKIVKNHQSFEEKSLSLIMNGEYK